MKKVLSILAACGMAGVAMASSPSNVNNIQLDTNEFMYGLDPVGVVQGNLLGNAGVEGPNATGPVCCYLSSYDIDFIPDDPNHKKKTPRLETPQWYRDCVNNAWNDFVANRHAMRSAARAKIMDLCKMAGCPEGWYRCEACYLSIVESTEHQIDNDYQYYESVVAACGPAHWLY